MRSSLFVSRREPGFEHRLELLWIRNLRDLYARIVIIEDTGRLLFVSEWRVQKMRKSIHSVLLIPVASQPWRLYGVKSALTA